MTTKTVLLFLGLALALELYVNASPISTTQESRNATPISTENKSSKTAIKVNEPKIDAKIEDVAFKAAIDATEQKYVLMTPNSLATDKSCDVLIALHGHGADRWQFVNDKRDECRASRDFAAKHGMLYISPDYRATTSWMGPKAEADVVQIIGDMRKNYSVSRVFITGASMGGSSCLTFAALHPELIDGVASMNGTANHVEYGNFQDAIKTSFGGTKDEIPEEYRKRSAELNFEKLTMPVGIAAGGKDTSVPPESVVRLAEKLKSKNKKVLLIYKEDGGHKTNYEDATAILEFMLANAGKK